MIDILKHEGKPAFAIIPYDLYQSMLTKLEDIEDIEDFDNIKAALAQGKEELIPQEVADRLLSDEHPVKVWREYRKLKQTDLSEKADITVSMISQIESGKKQGSTKTMKKLADALNVDIDDLVSV